MRNFSAVISVVISSVLLACSISFAHGGGAVTSAKIAELAAHRIDRLVALNKVDASFMKNTAKIEVADVENQAPVTYKAVISQTQPAQGRPLQVEMTFDKDGKPLAFQIVAGGTAGPDNAWPGVDSVALIENSLHYLFDNATDPKVAPFLDDLGTAELSKGNLAGQAVAVAHLVTMDGSKKMNVFLKLDGTFISAQAAQ